MWWPQLAYFWHYKGMCQDIPLHKSSICQRYQGFVLIREEDFGNGVHNIVLPGFRVQHRSPV